ncbi:MAG TPA: MBL fold metallo-hydrolase, partial [Anaerolineaceae bacterium]
HTGGLAALRAATGAAAAASQPEAEAIRAGTSSRKVGHRGIFGFLLRAISPFNLARPSPVDEILTPGQTLPVLGGMQVLSTPGHTPGHISLWCPGPQILFAGDSLVTRSGSFQVYQNWNVWRPDLAVESFRSQAQLHPALICAGHGWTDQDIEGKFARALAVEASNHGSRQ